MFSEHLSEKRMKHEPPKQCKRAIEWWGPTDYNNHCANRPCAVVLCELVL